MQANVDRALSEPKIRAAMSRLYATMVLSEPNTKRILSGGMGGPRAAEADGNHIAVSCMEDLDEWLRTLRMSAEPDLFENAIALPVRKSAEFLQHMRALKPRQSTDVVALVFDVSEPHHDDITGRDMRTVSAIAPGLESAVYVRTEDWEGDDIPGWYVFTSVQPIPLVNRMRKVKGSTVTPAGPSAGRAGLAGLGFLNCPLSAAEAFRRSLAMENFCEVRSWQAEGRHALGAPLILHGRVSSISPHRISLAGCDRGETFLSAYLSKGAAGMLPAGRTDGMRGAYARVLAVSWYRGDADPDPAPELEVYVIEEIDREGAIAGDASGLARVAGPVSVTDMRDRYGRVPDSALLERRGDRVIFGCTGGTGTGSPHGEFVRTVDAIRDARRKAKGSVHCYPESVFSDHITGDQMMHELGDAGTRDALLRIIEGEDRAAAVAKRLPRGSPRAGGLSSGSVRRLKSLGLVDETEDALVATSSGRRLGYRCSADMVGRRLGLLTATAVFVPDLDVLGIPPSFVTKYLKAAGYRPVEVRGSACRMVMCKAGAPGPDLKECADRAGRWMDAVLKEFDAVSHPLTPAYLAEKLKAYGWGALPIYVRALLNTMKNDGSVQEDGNDSWRVTLEGRVRRALEKNPGRALHKQQIVRSSAAIPDMNEDALDAVLERLCKDGVIVEVLKDRWVGSDKATDALAHGAYKAAVRLYGNIPEDRRRRMDGAAFLPYLERHLRDLGMKAGRRGAAEGAVDRMIKDGTWTGPL